MNRILLVEDEDNIRELLKYNLEQEQFEVVTAVNGTKALELLHAQHFDVVILDLMLPETDGFQVLESYRLSDRETPFIILSARNDTQDRILGLKLGADDYVSKPFSIDELILRVHKLIQRSKTVSAVPDVIHFAGNTVNFTTFEAKGLHGPFKMTKKEARLLKLLYERANQVVSRETILQYVWGYDVYPSTRTVDNFILSFRKNFEPDPKNPVIFYSIRGIGYQMLLP
jgi:two-component system alkaline phosphatase synthesis response regulator PhoP